MAPSTSLVIGMCVAFIGMYFYPQHREGIDNTAFIERNCDIHSYREGYVPNKCGRIIIGNFITDHKANDLVDIFNIAYYHSSGGGIGGPTIFDLISGALSSGTKFIDGFIKSNHEYKTNKESTKYFTKHHLHSLRTLMKEIEQQIRSHFNISHSTELYITSPIFFSKIFANRLPKTLNDEYFHYHNDTVAYPGFSYTALLYLSNHGVDFEGGIFDFKHGESVIPRKGKFLLMTSGGENEHRVSNVTHGERIAFTMAWTLDETKRAGSGHLFLSERETFFH